ncbi:hypothetical protein D3C72_910960 [compost metagenome]
MSIKSFWGICIVLLMLLSGCTERKSLTVGTFVNNTCAVGNIDKVKNYWTMVLEHNKMDARLENFKIVAKEDLKTGASYYLLVGANKDYSFNIATQVFREGNSIVLNDSSLIKGSASCQGCTTGCSPELSNGAWLCTNTCETACTKVITVAHEENNYTTPIQAFIERY